MITADDTVCRNLYSTQYVLHILLVCLQNSELVHTTYTLILCSPFHLCIHTLFVIALTTMYAYPHYHSLVITHVIMLTLTVYMYQKISMYYSNMVEITLTLQRYIRTFEKVVVFVYLQKELDIILSTITCCKAHGICCSPLCIWIPHFNYKHT